MTCKKWCIAQFYDGRKYWQKLYFEGMVGKYLANLNLNKRIYAYIINIAVKVHEKVKCLIEAIGLKRCSTKLLHVYNRMCI